MRIIFFLFFNIKSGQMIKKIDVLVIIKMKLITARGPQQLEIIERVRWVAEDSDRIGKVQCKLQVHYS